METGDVASGGAIDPIEQFKLVDVVPIHIGGLNFSLTNSAIYMFVGVAIVSILMLLGAQRGSLVPGRLQTLAETSYEFTRGMLVSSAGEHSMAFFPLVFCIFMFVLVLNVVSLVPYTFSVTAQVIVTSMLSLGVFFLVVIVGFAKNGAKFLKLFVPDGVPIYIMPLVVGIEIISFLSRPVSHSVRLFANMLAGHITLNVFGAFVLALIAHGAWVAVAPLPFAMTVAMFALELLVAFLQAYVFAILTCMYINDALHPVH